MAKKRSSKRADDAAVKSEDLAQVKIRMTKAQRKKLRVEAANADISFNALVLQKLFG